MKRFKENAFLWIVCVNFCLAGSIMAAERAKDNDFEASVKQGVVEFFNAVRQEQYEKLGFDDPVERQKGLAEFEHRPREAERQVREEVEARYKRLEQEATEAKAQEEKRLREIERLREENREIVEKLQKEEGYRKKLEEEVSEAMVRELGHFVSIPGGTYEIGSPPEEANRKDNEKLHSINLSEFSIMDAAVTQEIYAKVMGANPSNFKEQRYCPQSFKEIEVKGVRVPVCADHPVEMVSWDDANEFIRHLNARATNYKYALPTEAQIEVGFRGGTSTAYVTGRNDDIGLGNYVWYNGNSRSQTHPVKSKLANKFGIYRCGVQEWAQDWYEESYSSSTGLDPQGPTSGVYRVIRGGGWVSCFRNYFRSAARSGSPPGYRHFGIGFRLVRTVVQ
jgi:formylglycine-generating enzyme required for sulfatase activity